MPDHALTPQEAYQTLSTAFRHAQSTERSLSQEAEPVSTIAFTGALILGRAAFIAHMSLNGKVRPYRQLAHAILAQALDEVEMMMTETKGRA